MQVQPHLFFNHQCATAFDFYAEALGGKVTMMMTYGESPLADQMPPDAADAVMHASLSIGDTILMGADAVQGEFQTPQSFSVALTTTDPEEAERVFKALSENATIQMPMEQTFWSTRFGMLTDQFGIPWMVNCNQMP